MIKASEVSPVTPNADITYYYDTRCRRCGTLNAWYLWTGEMKTAKDTHKYMWERMPDPTVCNCEKCQRETIQDYASFWKKRKGDKDIYGVLYNFEAEKEGSI